MNNRLETYLAEVSEHLSYLPELRRLEEVTEIRQHLEADITARQETGEAEQKATETALAQFGKAKEVASGLRKVHRREQNIRLRRRWDTRPGVLVMSVVAPLLPIYILPWLSSYANRLL